MHTHTYSDRCLSKVALVQDKYVELQLCQYHAADDVLCKATGQKPNSSQVDLPLEYVPENLSRGYSPGIRVAQAYAAGQHGLRIDVHGTAGHHVLILQPNGMVLGVQDFLSSLHASVLESWRKVWGNMYSDALVSGPWQGELVFLDVLAFVLNAAKVRRSRNMPPWKNQSLTALQQLRTTFFQILHGAMAHSILEHVEANEAFERAVPSRRLSGQGRRLAVG